MKFRRALLLAPMLVLLWVGAASAQTAPCPTAPDDYNGAVCPSTTAVSPTTTLPPEVEEEEEGEEVEAQGGEAREAGLARTGANNIWPLIQAAIVLLGGGTLLVLVARRRRTERRSAA